MSRILGSIIIPAYNEGAVIRRCLDDLFTGLDPSEVEVVVACNGCTDDTVAQAEAAGYPIKVLDLAAPGKIGAIRAGEQAVSALPRLYLDADLEVSGSTVRSVLEAVAGDDPVAARPVVYFDTTASSWPVRRYYAGREALPTVMTDLCVAGFYAFSRSVRERFDEFPDVMGDDLFAARIVTQDEIVIVDSDPVTVHAPHRTLPLLHVLKRVYRGNQEFAAVRPDLDRTATTSTARDVLTLLRRPATAIDGIVFAWFAVTARILLRLDRNPVRWERDETSRV